MGAGSLYGAINTLNEKHWIEPYGSDAMRKKEYIITPLGKEIAEAEGKRLSEVLAIATQIMEGALS
ncbi:MAG: PadR family transcriptional regulator [Hungatella sp.]